MGRANNPLDPGSHREDPKPVVCRGHVSRAPGSALEAMWVYPVGFPASSSYEVVVGHWQPRGSDLPAKGDVCLLLFDHLGDAWVPIWQPSGSG